MGQKYEVQILIADDSIFSRHCWNATLRKVGV